MGALHCATHLKFKRVVRVAALVWFWKLADEFEPKDDCSTTDGCEPEDNCSTTDECESEDGWLTPSAISSIMIAANSLLVTQFGSG